jgi:hypothetical protein
VGNERPIGTFLFLFLFLFLFVCLFFFFCTYNIKGTGAGGKFIMDKLKRISNLVSDTVPM